MQQNFIRTIAAGFALVWLLMVPAVDSASVSKPYRRDRSHLFAPRIVGGRRELDPTVIMWQALFLEKGSVTCGGSVISHNKVVTAAHCDVRELDDDFEVRIGGQTNKDGLKFPIVKTYRHENFTRGPQNNPMNDLMVVEFHNPVKKLGIWAPRLNNVTDYPREDATLTASGYGRLGMNDSLPGHLRSVNVPVVPYEKCALSYSNIHRNNSICAGNEMFDSCKGDSGGPLWTRSEANSSEIVLIGIVSFGYGCAAPNAPGVYSRVSGYVDWIEEKKNLPDTKYVPKERPARKLIITLGAATGVAIVLASIVIMCILRRNKTKKQSQEVGES